MEKEGGRERVKEGEGTDKANKLDEVRQRDEEDEELRQIKKNREKQVATGISQDIVSLVADDFRERAGVDLDFQAINAVHANFN